MPAYTRYHPVFLDLNGRPVLIVGGGPIALEKLESLIPSGASLTVLSPELNEDVQHLLDEGKFRWIQKSFEPDDVEPFFMVIAATSDPAVNALVFQTGNARNRLSNSVDDPVNCNFIMAAFAVKGPMQVAISSAGCSPALAQQIRARIVEEILTDEVGDLGAYLGEWRPKIKGTLPNYRARRGYWERIVRSNVPGLLASGDVSATDAAMECALEWGKLHPNCLACGVKTGEFRCVCRPGEEGD